MADFVLTDPQPGDTQAGVSHSLQHRTTNALLVQMFGMLGGDLDEWLRRIYRATSYARDAAQRMRVIVDGGSITVADGPFLFGSGTAGTYRPFYDVRSINSIDPREQLRLAYRAQLEERMKRWEFT